MDSYTLKVCIENTNLVFVEGIKSPCNFADIADAYIKISGGSVFRHKKRQFGIKPMKISFEVKKYKEGSKIGKPVGSKRYCILGDRIEFWPERAADILFPPEPTSLGECLKYFSESHFIDVDGEHKHPTEQLKNKEKLLKDLQEALKRKTDECEKRYIVEKEKICTDYYLHNAEKMFESFLSNKDHFFDF